MTASHSVHVEATPEATQRDGSASATAMGTAITATGSSLPADLAHLLSAFPAPIAHRAVRVLRAGVIDRLANETPGAWRRSRLTGDGFPVEVAFSTADERLRLTMEPGAASDPPERRLDRADEVLGNVTGASLPTSIRRRVVDLQAGAALTYGAWLGCRLGDDGDEYKLYAEVPAGRVLGPNWPASPVLSGREVVPRMVAMGLADGAVETYLRVASLEPGHLPAVLDPVGLAHRSAWLIEYMEEAYRHTLSERIPGPSVGISYVFGSSPRVSLHLYARSLWGGDARIRRSFLRMARASGWDPRAYEHVSAPLATRDTWHTHHGILGITLAANAPPALTVGVRPVAP